MFHISSLPSPYHIGDLGDGAKAFVDFLVASGQSWWQILPIGPTSPVFGNSPYMSFSSLAGNPLFISPEILLRQGLLEADDIPPLNPSEYLVDYEQATALKNFLLAKAWQRFQSRDVHKELDEFSRAHPWVEDHALFLTLKDKFNYKPWYNWPKDYRTRNRKRLRMVAEEPISRLNYYRFEQYLFFQQWDELRKYANNQGIRILGDLPIYVAADSVDVWANQEIFQLNRHSSRPNHIAGVPPDYFSKTGQRWGNPLYRWNNKDERIENQLLDWWEKRLRMTFSQVDAIRIDHFRGFESYWSIPAREKTAINGTWVKGPGINFFQEMEKRLGRLPIIAEDLGVITPEVEKLRDDLEFPGMKILLFAFDGNTNNAYLPHNHTRNSVVYTGTHDNDTVLGWYLSSESSADAKKQIRRYANRAYDEFTPIHQDFIHLAMSSPSNLAVFPLQDILGFGNDCRMNTPSTSKDNWRWRCAPRFFCPDLAAWLYDQTNFFGRIPPVPPLTETAEKDADERTTDSR